MFLPLFCRDASKSVEAFSGTGSVSTLPCNMLGNAMAGKGLDTLDGGKAAPVMGAIPTGVGV